MLRSDPAALQTTFALDLIATLHGGGPTREVQTGVYEIRHFGSTDYLSDYDHWPELANLNSYGVCDTLQQLLDLGREELVEGPRIFLVTLHAVCKEDQPEEGGWRWKKWGPYIGTRQPTTEYLADEPDIDVVLVYNIYEKKSAR